VEAVLEEAEEVEEAEAEEAEAEEAVAEEAEAEEAVAEEAVAEEAEPDALLVELAAPTTPPKTFGGATFEVALAAADM